MVCAELCGAGLAALGAGASAAGTLITPPNGDGSFAMDLQRFAEGSTEVVQRAMSWAEFEATEETGLLRAGRACVNYLSDFVNSDALRARLRLALLQTPEVRVTMEVPSGLFSAPAVVQQMYGMPGGGMERVAVGQIPVRILSVLIYGR